MWHDDILLKSARSNFARPILRRERSAEISFRRRDPRWLLHGSGWLVQFALCGFTCISRARNNTMPVIIITGAAATSFLVPPLFRRSIILLLAMRDSPLVDYTSGSMRAVYIYMRAAVSGPIDACMHAKSVPPFPGTMCTTCDPRRGRHCAALFFLLI